MLLLSITLITYFRFLIAIACIFLALGFACAVWLACRHAGHGIGVRRAKHPQHVDPYFFPIGDVPGFTAEQLDQLALASHVRITTDPLARSLDLSLSAGALRRIAGGGHSESPSGMSAARNSFSEPARWPR